MQGATYHTIRLDDPDDRIKDPERIRSAIVAWRGQLSDGFGSLVLWAACDDHKDLQLPARFVELPGDPAYERATAKDAESLYPHLNRGIDFWLPGRFDFTFKAEDPMATLWRSVQR